MPSCKEYSDDIVKARTEKLFISRRFTRNGFRNPPNTYQFKNHSKLLFSFAGINISKFGGTRSLRRMFATLFVYRYDHPELLALKQHLRHLTLATTERYASDSSSRKLAERIETLYKKSMEPLLLDIEEVRKDYFNEKLIQMLSGEKIGGAFPRMVLKLLKRLSRSASFQPQTVSSLAKTVQARFERHGYKVTEKEHVACVLGDAKHTRKHAKCFKDGTVHPENATPSLCSGCVNGMTTENTISIYKVEYDELRKKSTDIRLRPSIRYSFAEQAQALQKLISVEENIAEENQAAFNNLFTAWEIPNSQKEAA